MALHGTATMTTSAARAASSFAIPWIPGPPPSPAAAAAARCALREPMITGLPAAASRPASPRPWSPVPPRTATTRPATSAPVPDDTCCSAMTPILPEQARAHRSRGVNAEQVRPAKSRAGGAGAGLAMQRR